jgi:ribosomal protein S18 acetylase RimI-like enzyme
MRQRIKADGARHEHRDRYGGMQKCSCHGDVRTCLNSMLKGIRRGRAPGSGAKTGSISTSGTLPVAAWGQPWTSKRSPVRGWILQADSLRTLAHLEKMVGAMTRSRRRMALDLRHAVPAEHELVASRPLVESDAPDLAILMLAAFRGTLDDEGEDIDQARDEVRQTFAGVYGPLMWNSSFVVDDESARPALRSASVITFWQGSPLLSFTVTHPRAGRSGLATALICQSARTLAAAGHTRLDLFVTRGNTPAERLYDKLGFRDVERA